MKAFLALFAFALACLLPCAYFSGYSHGDDVGRAVCEDRYRPAVLTAADVSSSPVCNLGDAYIYHPDGASCVAVPHITTTAGSRQKAGPHHGRHRSKRDVLSRRP